MRMTPSCQSPPSSTEEAATVSLDRQDKQILNGKEASVAFRGLLAGEIGHYCFPSDFTLIRRVEYQDNQEDSNLRALETISIKLYPEITRITHSRAGREKQRWAVDSATGDRIRLVVGTLPVLKEGTVLLVSSRKKEAWILPKGGWEADESMEECALRETFEEAGVWGLLGPPFPLQIYDSGRHKTTARQPPQHKTMMAPTTTNDLAAPTDLLSGANGSAHNGSSDGENTSLASDSESDRTSLHSTHTLRNHTKEECQLQQREQQDSYAKVHLVIFPLYVKTVSSQWPESFRKRKVATLDRAMHDLQNRPEFLAAIKAMQLRSI